MKKVKILPVKGKNYETGYLNGKKLMLCRWLHSAVTGGCGSALATT